MDPAILLLLILITLTLAGVFYLLKHMQQVRTDLQNQVSDLHQTVSSRFDANVQTVAGHLGIITGQISNTTTVVAQVEGKLGQVQEASKQIFDLARQIASLQDILQSPKMRGGLGEFLLSELIAQCLESSAYKFQHRFASGTIVDAALFIGNRTLCIDSKFPLENLRRSFTAISDEEKRSLRKLFYSDVKKHINAISEKYILPDEGTYDFALMFVPAENVYYEIIVRDENDLSEYCRLKKVIPVSPNTLYAYLQVILLGLRGFQISEKAREILGQLQQIGHDLDRFEVEFQKAGSHLHDLQNTFTRTDMRLQKLKKKMAALGSEEFEEYEV